ncbi:hypothetical protein A3758_17375 [Oleiphilus sp. HI0118]|nr:hypothetical protein A3758_17375 [Oleiphilus sp. HI0118]
MLSVIRYPLSVIRYPLWLCLAATISFQAHALTLEQAKKETAHIKSLNEAKAFMYFNPHAMYRKALTNRSLTVAKSKTCSYVENGKRESRETISINLNEKGEPIDKEYTHTYNDEGRIVLRVNSFKNDATERKGQYRYIYNTNGTLKTVKSTYESKFSFRGNTSYTNIETRRDHSYKGNRLVSWTEKKTDYIEGTVQVSNMLYEYDDDFKEYCSIRYNSDNQLEVKDCSDYKFDRYVKGYKRDAIGEGTDKKVASELNEYGDYRIFNSVIFQRTNPSDRVETITTCDYDYEQRKFQFYGN